MTGGIANGSYLFSTEASQLLTGSQEDGGPGVRLRTTPARPPQGRLLIAEKALARTVKDDGGQKRFGRTGVHCITGLTPALPASTLKVMAVHLNPVLQAKVDQWASETGRPADELVEDAMAGYI